MISRSLFRLSALCITLLLGASLFVSCSSVTPELPPITATESGVHDTGRVIWHELLTTDLEKTKEFYGELFGWDFTRVGLSLSGGRSGEYMVIMHQGKPIGGVVDTSLIQREVPLVQWVSVLSVADIETTTRNINASQGTVYAVADLGPRGEMAVVADEQGGLFAVLETANGDPAFESAAVNEFLWDELWTSDRDSAGEFYQQVFAYQENIETLDNGSTYHYYTGSEDPRVGIIDNPVEGLDPTWVTYIRVADADAIVARVPELGGTVMMDVQPNPLGGELAIIRDPDGVGFVVQTWDN